MLLEEADRASFKQWIVPKLETISDADASVLADYVIALIIAEESEHAVKQNCLDSLSDFLQDPKLFVEEVLSALKHKSFLPAFSGAAKPAQFFPIPVAPITSTPIYVSQAYSEPVSAAPVPSAPVSSVQRYPISSVLSAEARPFNPPTGPSAAAKPQTQLPDRPTGPSPSINLQSRVPGLRTHVQNGRGTHGVKRKLNDREPGRSRDSPDSHYNWGAGAERPLKHTARRGDRDISRGQDPRELFVGAMPGHAAILNPAAPMLNVSAPPLPSAGFPPFNPTDPMSFLAMAALGMGFPGMPQLPFASSPFAMGLQGSNGQTHLATRKERCKDYDTKGFCVLGSVCPYNHGEEAILAQSADEYDLSHASLTAQREQSINGQHELSRGQNHDGVGSRSGPSSGRTRAPFSQAGPTSDRTNVTVVVEQIPEEFFREGEGAVRKFFSQFGHIVTVEMHAYNRLAIVEYNDHFAARRAYDSPKAIFDNRFVKVYWYKPESLLVPTVNGKNGINNSTSPSDHGKIYKENEEILDAEEIEKRQAEAQRAWEERQKKVREITVKLESVQEQIKAKESEVRELSKKVAAKGGVELIDESNDAALMDQLKLLQAEAKNLGLDAQVASFSLLDRGRGGYRARGSGSYPVHGQGSWSFRGGYRGGGALYPGVRTSVKRLDNRSKRLAITGIENGSLKDEALRQHLLKGYELDSITRHPTEDHTLLVAFKERYMAEMFLDDSLNIPHIGKLELAWVPNDVSVSSKGQPGPSDQLGTGRDSGVDVPVESTETADDVKGLSTEGGDEVNGNNVNDYDVADDVDEWL